MLDAWWHGRVIASLIRASASPSDAMGVIEYFASRRSPFGRARGGNGVTLSLDGLPAPLYVSNVTGGLATYYEVVVRSIYSPSADFLPRAGQVVVDVGANVGVYALWCSGLVGSEGHVVAVEPHPDAYQALASNVSGQQNLTLRQVACTAQSGELELHVVPGRLSVTSAFPRPDATERVCVATASLAAIVADAGLRRVDLLKVDVEGLELDVLRSAGEAWALIDRVVLETTVDQLQEVVGLLSSHGLRLMHVQTGMWNLPWAVAAAFARPARQSAA